MNITTLGPRLTFEAPPAPPSARWPANVPSREEAWRLMFDSARLPVALRGAALEVLHSFEEKGLAKLPPGLEVNDWLLALSTTWRLKAAAALAWGQDSHDEAALQAMLEEAAHVREWLTTLAAIPGFDGAREARELHALLQSNWGELLDAAPPPPELPRLDPPPPPVRARKLRTVTAARALLRRPASSSPRLTKERLLSPPRAERVHPRILAAHRRTILLASLLAALTIAWWPFGTVHPVAGLIQATVTLASKSAQ